MATWSADVSPASRPDPADSFLDSAEDDEVLVAEANGEIAGFAQIGRLHGLESSAHVLELKSIAVHPRWQRQGIGALLVAASLEAARRRNARRLVLRVLGTNLAAMALYERHGFCTEGVLREQFFLAGRYVDDVFMAHDLVYEEPVPRDR